MPEQIKVRGARVHNLKNIDVDVPLNQIVAIAGVSGSGKSSLALGVLYAEGSRRYLDALSTYTRRRMTQAMKAQVDEVLYVPAALALHQRPGVPGIRSTFGTGTELLNSLRLMFSRLASHRCPNGHYVPPTLAVAAEQPIFCPACGAEVHAPSAEELAFNSQGACPTCGGTRLSKAARTPRLRGISLDKACKMPLSKLVEWVAGVPASLPSEMRPMAESICQSFQTVAKRLMDLGLGYLSLDRAASTLSTGERQRMQLARAVRNRTTGVLYVLDEPSIGLHPSNIVGLTGVMRNLVADGNSVILVDHDTQILSEADWLIEMGPEAGASGGRVVAQGTISDIAQNKSSQIGPFLAGTANIRVRDRAKSGELFDLGTIHLSTGAIHTVKSLNVDIPKGRLTVVTGVSGSGKTTLVLESLVPGLTAAVNGQQLPEHALAVEAADIRQVKLIDATPIGINVRSTVATYANVHDELRKRYAKTRTPSAWGSRLGTFPTTPGGCAVRCATVPGSSIWTYSFCPM